MGRTRASTSAIAVFAVVILVAGVWYAVSSRSSVPSRSPGRVTLPTEPKSNSTQGAKSRSRSQAVPTFRLVTAFYLGPGPRGPVLHRTTSPAPPETDRLELALETLEAQPDVPTYRTWWKPGWLASAKQVAGRIDVDVSDAPSSRPSAMDATTALRCLQQVVYTVQAATHSHDPVQFVRDGHPAASVLGVATGQPVQAQPMVQVMALMNVLEPSVDEGVVGRKPYRVSGTGNTAEGAVTVRLLHGGRVLQTRTGRMSGAGDLDRLYPWHVVIDISGLAKGTYQVVASGPDPTDSSLTVTDQQPLILD